MSTSMFAYYFDLALRSFRRNKALTTLMVLAIALGIGACMTTLTVFHVLSGDPIPNKSHRLFYPQMDPQGMQGYVAGDEPELQLTRYDAEALLRQHRGDRQALMAPAELAIEPQHQGLQPFSIQGRYTSSDFFPMFETPFAQGSGWSAADDSNRSRVVVLSKELNDKLFGGGNSIGKTVRLSQHDFRVVGVLANWRLTPKFYDIYGDKFGDMEQAYLPFSTSRDLDMDRSGSMNCWKPKDPSVKDDPEGETGLNAPCTWIQYWVELDSPEKVSAYHQYLTNYSDQQRAAGRFDRPTNVRLRNVMELLDFNHAVPSDVRLQTWLAFGFMIVCLLNTVGLLLAKFLRRSSEIGVRRALGASRRAIFMQCMVEAGVVGLAGGACGLGLALLGLWAVRHQPSDYAKLAHLDPTMLLTTFAISIVASLLAGALPAWRACQVAPAIQLKSQ